MRNRFIHMLTAATLVGGFLQAQDYDPEKDKGLVIHEWGTFTSIQGSDGNLMYWNPFETDELPRFVYDRSHPLTELKSGQPAAFAADRRIPSKARGTWRQRMETPVIYAYSQDALELDVRVDFPAGQITEWYPQVTGFGPSVAHIDGLPVERDSFVRWKHVTVETGESDPEPLPSEAKANHYYEARDVDANVLTATKGLLTGFEPQQEKFLFYRGVGDFKTPLHVRFDSPRSLVLRNTGKDAIPFLLFLEVIEGRAAFQVVSGLEAKGDERLKVAESAAFREVPALVPEIGKALVTAFVENGLYEKEAKSMVATWKSSWLTESGTRVLYVLPRSWTDKTLPIQVSPAPKAMERVMVGRAELIAPRVEDALQSYFTRFDRGEANTSETLASIAQLDLGRFTEPALTRLRDLQFQLVRHRIHGLKHGSRVALTKKAAEENLAVSSVAP